jgi:hypothetical protein
MSGWLKYVLVGHTDSLEKLSSRFNNPFTYSEISAFLCTTIDILRILFILLPY